MARILICDDAKFMRDVISDILQLGGHKVLAEVGSADDAVVKYKELKPDLVTMDILMQNKMGSDAVKDILAFDPKAKIMIVSVLGDNEEQVVKAIKLGASGIVSKPLTKDTFLEEVERVLKL